MSVRKTLSAKQLRSKYDHAAKKLVSNKSILAHIIGQTIEEFKGVPPQEIVPYIEGKPYVGEVYMDSGMTNTAGGESIAGFNTEDSEVNEGMIRFDVICYVRTRDGHAQLILNIEIQKDDPTSYDIMNRAVYYVSRAISSQKEREFRKMNYNGIKRVYCIWLCLNIKEDGINHIHLQDERLIGNISWKGDLNLINIIMIGIASEKKSEEAVEKQQNDFFRMLRILFSDEMNGNEKIKVLNRDYQIPDDSDLREEVETMCNLSEGIWERAMKQGIEKGIEKGQLNIEKERKRADEADRRANEAEKELARMREELKKYRML